MNVEVLESIVSRLSADELARFSQWFEVFMAEQWDRRIEQDMLDGRLAAALTRADDHYKSGCCTPIECRAQSGTANHPSTQEELGASRAIFDAVS